MGLIREKNLDAIKFFLQSRCAEFEPKTPLKKARDPSKKPNPKK